jgi:hypothetical protein
MNSYVDVGVRREVYDAIESRADSANGSQSKLEFCQLGAYEPLVEKFPATQEACGPVFVTASERLFWQG